MGVYTCLQSLFQDIPLQDCVVVVDDDVFKDGRALIHLLAATPHKEVEKMRRNIRILAPIMQWGWGGEK